MRPSGLARATEFGGRDAVAAALVVDHDRLAPHRRQLLGIDARADIGRGAGRERHDHGHAARRPGLRAGKRTGRRTERRAAAPRLPRIDAGRACFLVFLACPRIGRTRRDFPRSRRQSSYYGIASPHDRAGGPQFRHHGGAEPPAARHGRGAGRRNRAAAPDGRAAAADAGRAGLRHAHLARGGLSADRQGAGARAGHPLRRPSDRRGGAAHEPLHQTLRLAALSRHDQRSRHDHPPFDRGRKPDVVRAQRRCSGAARSCRARSAAPGSPSARPRSGAPCCAISA